MPNYVKRFTSLCQYSTTSTKYGALTELGVRCVSDFAPLLAEIRKNGQEFSESLLFLEVNTAGSLCDVFRFGPWVFSAIHGAEGVYFANSLALGVKFKPRADIGEFAAGATTETLAPAVF